MKTTNDFQSFLVSDEGLSTDDLSPNDLTSSTNAKGFWEKIKESTQNLSYKQKVLILLVLFITLVIMTAGVIGTQSFSSRLRDAVITSIEGEELKFFSFIETWLKKELNGLMYTVHALQGMTLGYLDGHDDELPENFYFFSEKLFDRHRSVQYLLLYVEGKGFLIFPSTYEGVINSHNLLEVDYINNLFPEYFTVEGAEAISTYARIENGTNISLHETMLLPIYSGTKPDSKLWGVSAASISFSQVPMSEIASEAERLQMNYIILLSLNETFYVISQSPSFDENMSQDELEKLLKKHTSGHIENKEQIWIGVGSRDKRIPILEQRLQMFIAIEVCGCLLLCIIAVALIVLCFEKYDPYMQAPKSTPFAILKVGPVRAGDLWSLAPEQMRAVTTKWKRIIEKLSKELNVYQAPQLQPYTNTFVLKSVDEAVELGLSLLEYSKKKDFDLPLVELLGEGGRFNVTCIIHWCTDAMIKDQVQDRIVQYSGSDVLLAVKLWMISTPRCVLLTKAAMENLTEIGRGKGQLQFEGSVFISGFPMTQDLYVISSHLSSDGQIGSGSETTYPFKEDYTNPLSHGENEGEEEFTISPSGLYRGDPLVSAFSSSDLPLVFNDPDSEEYDPSTMCSISSISFGTSPHKGRQQGSKEVTDSTAVTQMTSVSSQAFPGAITPKQRTSLNDIQGASLRLSGAGNTYTQVPPSINREKTKKPFQLTVTPDSNDALSLGSFSSGKLSPFDIKISKPSSYSLSGSGIQSKERSKPTVEGFGNSRELQWIREDESQEPPLPRLEQQYLGTPEMYWLRDAQRRDRCTIAEFDLLSPCISSSAVLKCREGGAKNSEMHHEDEALNRSQKSTKRLQPAGRNSNDSRGIPILYPLSAAKPLVSHYSEHTGSSEVELRELPISSRIECFDLSRSGPLRRSDALMCSPVDMESNINFRNIFSSISAYGRLELEQVFEMHPLSSVLPFDVAKPLIALFYIARQHLFQPLSDVEHENIKECLACAFGIPSETVLPYLAVHGALCYLQQNEDMIELLWGEA